MSTATETDEDALMESLSPNELRMMNLLGNGITQEIVAQTCGVSPSLVSQMMATEGFASLVNKLRFEKLQATSEIDGRYDSMESQLQTKMEKVIPMLIKPRDILDFATRLNQMKRRNPGATTPQDSQKNIVLNLSLPTAIINKLVIDPNTNRVIEANGQEMLTLQSNNVMGALNESKERRVEKLPIPKGRVPSASDL